MLHIAADNYINDFFTSASPVIIIRLIRQWSVPEAENHLDRSRTLKKFDFENPSSSLSQNDKNDLGR